MVLEVKNIFKSFGNACILRDVSFTVDKGEIVGFIGPNGAGKTTAIKVILGLLRPDSGNVYIDGHSISQEHDMALSSIGAIIESPELYPYLTGKENLMQFARICGISEERVNECAEIVGLSSKINQKVSKYSLGMRQRLGVAQAILNYPRLLILDEPTNGLDPSGIKDLREMLKSLAESGVAVLVSSHLLSELDQFCTSAVIIEHGVIVDKKSLKEQESSETSENTLQYLFITGNNSAALEALSAIGVNAEIIKDNLFVSAARDKIPLCVNTLVNSGIELYGLESKKKTLEESYLEATTSEI